MAAMDGVGQRTTSFQASSMRLVPRLVSVPEGPPGLSLASAARGEPKGPSTLLTVVRAPSVRTSRRPMRVRIAVAPSCEAVSDHWADGTIGAGRHDAYASCEETLASTHLHEKRYRRPARRGVGLGAAGKPPDSRTCTVGTT